MRVKVQISLCLVLAMHSFADAQDDIPVSPVELDALNSYRDLLETTEAEFGRDALGLVEPLEQLADRLMVLDQFYEADSLLDRAVQITRYHNGLHTPAQLSLIKKRIENFSNRQAWQYAREQMDYLYAYYLRVPVALNENLISDLLGLAEQHLRGAIEDSEIERARHLSRVYQINQAIIVSARELYGAGSPLLAPYLYRQVKHLYMFQKGYEAGGRGAANSMLYYTLRGQEFGWGGNSFDRFTYGEGLLLLEQIREIFAQLEAPDPEGLAMSELYIADWYILYDYAAEAMEIYENVYAALIASGLSDNQVATFFGEPRILPLQQFFASTAAAIESLPEYSPNNSGDREESVSHEFTFVEWLPSYPTVRNPSSVFNQSIGESDFALMEFRLAAENESTFLYKHRYRTMIGAAEDIELLREFRSTGEGSPIALDRMEQLRFRPKIVAGVIAESYGFLRYDVAAEAIP